MIETQIVGEKVAGESAKTLSAITNILRNMKQGSFDLAELLHKTRANGWYRPEYDTFSEYLKSLEEPLDIKSQTLKYLEHIADVMEQVNIDRNTYEPLGTSKLREITSLDPNGTWINPDTKEETPLRDFITGFIEKPDMPLKDIKEHVKTLKGLVGDRNIENRTFGWTKATIQEVIDPAIELARRNIGSVGRDAEGTAVDASPSKCVEMWAIEYMNDPANNVIKEE